MRSISRRSALRALAATSCTKPPASAQQSSDTKLPAGVTAIWDLAKAYRESTATRERICINGLWRWQPAAASAEAAPSGGWGYLRVPENWPGGNQRWAGPQVFYPHPDWPKDLGAVTAAWQQREIAVPRQWSGRRVTL